MVMVGHAQRLAQPLTRRQRRAIALTAAIIAGAILWAVLRSGGAPASARGCVNVIVASSTGAATVHACGAAARTWCASEAAVGAPLRAQALTQCRLAGLRPRGGG